MSTNSPRDSILPSIAFWLCLFVAAGLFGAVVLLPKWLAAERLAARHRQIEQRLDGLARQNAYLKRMVAALENDPQFAAELARFELGASRPGERRIAADARLAFPAAPAAQPERVMSGWIRALEPFANDQTVRNAALFTAAGLLVAGFAFFPVRHDDEA
jgi:cell division protein FtsB